MRTILLIFIVLLFNSSSFGQASIKGALMRDDGSYMVWYNTNEAWWSGVPKSLSDKILELNKDGKTIKQVTLRGDGAWLVLWDKNEAAWENVPTELSDKILELNKDGKTIKHVAMRDDGAYIILWDKNEAWWNGIPKEMSDKILELNKDDKTIKQVGMRADGGYFIMWDINEAWWNNIPKGLSDKILQLNRDGRTINHAAISNNGGYIIFWDTYEYAWMDIPSGLSSKIEELTKRPVAENDFTAPEITIYTPAVSRGYKVTVANEQVYVSGKATDKSGISQVLINELPASVDAYGNFNLTLNLTSGDNTFTVKAIDNKNNAGTFTFYINKTQDVVVNDVIVNDNPVGENDKRLALVIGNSNYEGGQYLKNPANDANQISQTLKSLGFEVITRTDAKKVDIEQAVREFSKKLPNYNVALFYYAGHGIQVDGINYLLPTDAKLQEKTDCKYEAVSVNFIVEEFELYPNNTNIVILDACRNDPFRSWSRGGERGFKAISPSSGTIIAFATSEGATASDGAGQNGLFTQELVKQMKIPQSIENVFKKTRVEVEKLSKNAQSPQEWTKLKGDFWFKK
jgi:hypothetical protein